MRENAGAIFLFTAMLLTILFLSMTGCAQSPKDGVGSAHQRTIAIICILSMCEQEHADNTHGKVEQDEDEDGELDAEVPASIF